MRYRREDAPIGRLLTARSRTYLRLALARIGDHRDEADRQLAQLLGPVRGIGVEKQGIAGGERVGLVAVAIADLAFQHIEELDPGVLEQWEHVRFRGQRDQVGLDRDAL